MRVSNVVGVQCCTPHRGGHLPMRPGNFKALDRGGQMCNTLPWLVFCAGGILLPAAWLGGPSVHPPPLFHPSAFFTWCPLLLTSVHHQSIVSFFPFRFPPSPLPILYPLWSSFVSQANARTPAAFPTPAPSASAPTPTEEHTNAPTARPGYISSAQASRGQLIGTPIGGARPSLPPQAPHPPTPSTPHPPPSSPPSTPPLSPP